jgi:hypothetical protein
VDIAATYRTEGKHVVFDRREVCNTYAGSEPVCLEMVYGAYRFGPASLPVRKPRKDIQKGAKAIEEAGRMARQAAELMRKGDIRGAFRAYQKLVEDYGQTPQGAEARELLKGVPQGL